MKLRATHLVEGQEPAAIGALPGVTSWAYWPVHPSRCSIATVTSSAPLDMSTWDYNIGVTHAAGRILGDGNSSYHYARHSAVFNTVRVVRGRIRLRPIGNQRWVSFSVGRVRASFDLIAGAVGVIGTTTPTLCTITPVGDGWMLLEIQGLLNNVSYNYVCLNAIDSYGWDTFTCPTTDGVEYAAETGDTSYFSGTGVQQVNDMGPRAAHMVMSTVGTQPDFNAWDPRGTYKGVPVLRKPSTLARYMDAVDSVLGTAVNSTTHYVVVWHISKLLNEGSTTAYLVTFTNDAFGELDSPISARSGGARARNRQYSTVTYYTGTNPGNVSSKYVTMVGPSSSYREDDASEVSVTLSAINPIAADRIRMFRNTTATELLFLGGGVFVFNSAASLNAALPSIHRMVDAQRAIWDRPAETPNDLYLPDGSRATKGWWENGLSTLGVSSAVCPTLDTWEYTSQITRSGTGPWSIRETAETGRHYNYTEAVTNDARTWARCTQRIKRAGTLQWYRLDVGANFKAHFDLVNGVVGNYSAGVTATITSVGSGWFDIEVFARGVPVSNMSCLCECMNSDIPVSGNPSYLGNVNNGVDISSHIYQQVRASSISNLALVEGATPTAPLEQSSASAQPIVLDTKGNWYPGLGNGVVIWHESGRDAFLYSNDVTLIAIPGGDDPIYGLAWVGEFTTDMGPLCWRGASDIPREWPVFNSTEMGIYAHRQDGVSASSTKVYSGATISDFAVPHVGLVLATAGRKRTLYRNGGLVSEITHDALASSTFTRMYDRRYGGSGAGKVNGLRAQVLFSVPTGWTPAQIKAWVDPVMRNLAARHGLTWETASTSPNDLRLADGTRAIRAWYEMGLSTLGTESGAISGVVSGYSKTNITVGGGPVYTLTESTDAGNVFHYVNGSAAISATAPSWTDMYLTTVYGGRPWLWICTDDYSANGVAINIQTGTVGTEVGGITAELLSSSGGSLSWVIRKRNTRALRAYIFVNATEPTGQAQYQGDGRIACRISGISLTQIRASALSNLAVANDGVPLSSPLTGATTTQPLALDQDGDWYRGAVGQEPVLYREAGRLAYMTVSDAVIAALASGNDPEYGVAWVAEIAGGNAAAVNWTGAGTQSAYPMYLEGTTPTWYRIDDSNAYSQVSWGSSASLFSSKHICLVVGTAGRVWNTYIDGVHQAQKTGGDLGTATMTSLRICGASGTTAVVKIYAVLVFAVPSGKTPAELRAWLNPVMSALAARHGLTWGGATPNDLRLADGTRAVRAWYETGFSTLGVEAASVPALMAAWTGGNVGIGAISGNPEQVRATTDNSRHYVYCSDPTNDVATNVDITIVLRAAGAQQWVRVACNSANWANFDLVNGIIGNTAASCSTSSVSIAAGIVTIVLRRRSVTGGANIIVDLLQSDTTLFTPPNYAGNVADGFDHYSSTFTQIRCSSLSNLALANDGSPIVAPLTGVTATQPLVVDAVGNWYTGAVGQRPILYREVGRASIMSTTNATIIAVANGNDVPFWGCGIFQGTGDWAMPCSWQETTGGLGTQYDIPFCVYGVELRSYRQVGGSASNRVFGSGLGGSFATPQAYAFSRNTDFTIDLWIAGVLVGTVTHADLGAMASGVLMTGRVDQTTPVTKQEALILGVGQVPGLSVAARKAWFDPVMSAMAARHGVTWT